MYHSFLIHSSADGHLGCFHVLAIYKQCCDEHWGTPVSFPAGFLSVYAQQWDCWRRLLRVPWTARRSIHSILKEISSEYSLEGLMLKLKLQYFGHLMQITDSSEKTLMLGKIEGGREGDNTGWDCWMSSLTQWTGVWVASGSWWCTGKPGVLQSMGLQRVGHDWATELNWTEI